MCVHGASNSTLARVRHRAPNCHGMLSPRLCASIYLQHVLQTCERASLQPLSKLVGCSCSTFMLNVSSHRCAISVPWVCRLVVSPEHHTIHVSLHHVEHQPHVPHLNALVSAQHVMLCTTSRPSGTLHAFHLTCKHS